MDEAPNPVTSSAESGALPRFNLRQRILLRIIPFFGSILIRAIGRTLRYSISYEEGAPGTIAYRPMVVSFWHNCIFPATYIARDLGIRVLSSDSFDGEWTGRIIRKFGFVKVRGSASRGAIRGLIGMKREVEQGNTVVFTIDGPRGPRYVAKPGPVLLASSTGAPMVAFYVAVEKAWILKTWDRCVIPKPFSRALFRMGRGIDVPKDAEREKYLAELQSALENTRIFAEENVGRVGTKEFPIMRR